MKGEVDDLKRLEGGASEATAWFGESILLEGAVNASETSYIRNC